MKAYRPKPRDEVARNMRAIRSTENATEAALRSALHRLGLRFRKYRKALPGRPDIVFPRERVAVFIDGDYWHARLLVEAGPEALAQHLARLAEPSRVYWTDKFTRRVARDREVTGALRELGWAVLRYWESDVKRDVAGTARAVAEHVRQRRAAVQGVTARPGSGSTRSSPRDGRRR